jgi:hypothetical protein
MEDIPTISVDGVDVFQTVNVDDSRAETLKGDWGIGNATHLSITGDNPYNIASEMAESNWEWSDEAVIAVIQDSYPFEEVTSSGEITGQTPSDPVIKGEIKGEKDPGLTDPNEHEFMVEENYKYVEAKMTWGEDWDPFKEQLERGKDPDLQLYCGELGQVAASAEWNVLSGATEHIGSYIYYPGEWWYAVTYMPTQLIPDEEQQAQLDQMYLEYQEMNPPIEDGTDTFQDGLDTDTFQDGLDTFQDGLDTFQDGMDTEPPIEDGIDTDNNPDFPPWKNTAKYTIEYSLYPGTDIFLPIDTPYACRDATFELTWSSSQSLGLILCGPSGAEIATSMVMGARSQILNVPALGEGNYKISVVNLDEDSTASDFSVRYEWRQTRPDAEADCISNAANGAVLASTINAPLLYASPRGIPKSTLKMLDLQGVTKVFLINLNEVGSSKLKEKLEDHRSWLQPDLEVQEFRDYEGLYHRIQSETKENGMLQNDVVFSCVESHSTWGANTRDENPNGEEIGGHFFGPATLMAAFHGCPVFITEAHPSLSCAQAWHNEFWRKAYRPRAPPSVGCMVLEGKEVYSFLQEYGFDREGQESIITVAEQFDIGTAWDRALVGPACSGRIIGTPTDCSVWISRSLFYPDLIFANPAVDPSLDPTGGSRIQGSSSTRIAGVLSITQDEREEVVELPVLESWVSYDHKFNELASKYWGCDYTTATGITPHWDTSGDDIDPNGKWPDLTTSEMVPYYFEKVGYDEVFTTGFDATMENLNRGAVLWFEVMHGGSSRGGCLGFWNQDDFESNPWRGYEENLMTLQGATDNPDVVTMSKQIGLDILPTNPNFLDLDALERHDGVIIAIAQQTQTTLYTGFDMNEAMDNVHSVGFSAGSCLIACSYLHTALVRHGSVFQVTDPWLTSWYSSFAMETFVRDMAKGNYTVGEMYERGIKHVGIEYLIDGWWWDIYENLVYYGDPDLMIYSPQNLWEKPKHLPTGMSVDGHNVFGAKDHPHAIGDRTLLEIAIIAGIIIAAVAAGVFVFYKFRQKRLAAK